MNNSRAISMLQNAHARVDVFEAEGIAIITNYHEQKAIVLSFCFCLLFSTICWQTNEKQKPLAFESKQFLWFICHCAERFSTSSINRQISETLMLNARNVHYSHCRQSDALSYSASIYYTMISNWILCDASAVNCGSFENSIFSFCRQVVRWSCIN